MTRIKASNVSGTTYAQDIHVSRPCSMFVTSIFFLGLKGGGGKSAQASFTVHTLRSYINYSCTGIWDACLGSLKVLTNEKRGGLRVISFDRSPLKIISRKFSKESVQAPSCERHKTTQRTLFLLFANNS
jgi:hypothetical protein